MMEDKQNGRSILSFRQIEIFRAIMIAKSVNGAGRMLNCAQPGLSQALKHMESKMGFQLFLRSNGRLAPTQEALQLFEEVQFLYKDVERVDQVVRRLAAGGDRIFRLGAPPSLGHSLVPIMLKHLRQRYKDVGLHFEIQSREQVKDFLLFQRGECALTVFEIDHPDIESECIGRGRMVCVVHASHPLASSRKMSVKALNGQDVISFEHDTAHAHAVRSVFQQAGADLTISTLVRFAETAMALVQQGIGVAIVDEFTATHERYPDICIINLAEEAFVPIYINRSRSLPRSAAGDFFEIIARKICADWGECDGSADTDLAPLKLSMA